MTKGKQARTGSMHLKSKQLLNNKGFHDPEKVQREKYALIDRFRSALSKPEK